MAFGIEFYNSSGTKILDLNNRTIRFVQSGTATVPAEGSVAVSVTGMRNNDSWNVLFSPADLSQLLLNSLLVTVVKSTDSVSFVNAFSQDIELNYWITRS